MREQKLRVGSLWAQVITTVDGFLIPVSLGMLSMLILVQLLSLSPFARSRLDVFEGRFATMPAQVIPATVNHEQATISLRLSPDHANPSVRVFNNGKLVGNFINSEMQVRVREGDRLSVSTSGAGAVIVMVDHNNANLLVPAPGQMVELTSSSPQATLPSVQFTH